MSKKKISLCLEQLQFKSLHKKNMQGEKKEKEKEKKKNIYVYVNE